MSWWSKLWAILRNDTDWATTARWPGPTVAVWLDTELSPGAQWSEHIAAAIGWWNAALPRAVLIWCGPADRIAAQRARANPMQSDLQVLVVADNLDDSRAHTELYWTGPWIRSALVPLPEHMPAKYELARTIARHEIGHVLGLGHARAPQSIMWPRAAESEGLVLSQERKMLRERYR